MKLSESKLIWIIAALIVLLCVVFGFFRIEDSIQKFRLAKITRGDLDISISATGVLQPEEVIDVGAQVAGKISSFGTDAFGKTIDYGSFVEEGTVLARIDDALYSADVAQASATLKRAEAEVLQSKAKLMQASRDWARAQKLGPSDALAKSSYDAYQAAYEIAAASVSVAEASKAEAEAVLNRAKQNLDYCIIKSPVKGVIIDRRVNIGQTVVSSLNAPSLFLLAKDLKRMQVWVSVNEADVANIRPGVFVAFTVDAFRGETFQGEVGKIRLNATMTQNVVTYTVEVLTDNSSGKLLPYLTANAQFEVAHKKNVMLVPNAALRWNPKSEDVSSEFRKNETDPARVSSSSAMTVRSRGTIWKPEGQFARPISVEIGANDNTQTEIRGDISEGSEVIIGLQTSEVAGAKTSSEPRSPFAPQMPGGKGR